MKRSELVPQGIRANRAGYPTRYAGEAYVYGADRSALLRRYSDEQLTQVDRNLVRGENGLKVVRNISMGLGAFVMTDYALLPLLSVTAPLIHIHPIDTVLNAILDANAFAFQKYIDFATLFGKPEQQISALGAAAFAPILLPAFTYSFAEQALFTKESQRKSVGSEQMRRLAEKLAEVQSTQGAKIS